MIQKTRVMLYVNDVEMICRFFVEKIGAEISETIELPEEFKSIVLSISKELELGVFPKVFVQKFSPEVLGPPPSLVFLRMNLKLSTRTWKNQEKSQTTMAS